MRMRLPRCVGLLSVSCSLVCASLLCAALAGVAVLGVGPSWPASLGIDPTRHSYGAAVWTLLLWAAIHVGIGALMAIW